MDGAKYPEGVKFRDQLGMTVLTKACRAISCIFDEEIAAPDLCTEKTSRICRFVIQECPKAFLSKHLEDADSLFTTLYVNVVSHWFKILSWVC